MADARISQLGAVPWDASDSAARVSQLGAVVWRPISVPAIVSQLGLVVWAPRASITFPIPTAGRELVIGRIRIPSEGTYWAGIAITDRHDNGQYHEPRVLAFSDLREASSDRRGRLQETSATVTAQDRTKDGDAPPFRTWLERQGRTLRNREVFIELNSHAGIIRGDLWHTLFRGHLERWKGLPHFGFELEARHWLQRTLRQPVLKDTVGAEFASTAPATVRDRKVPLLLGRESDEGSTTAPPTIVADADGPGSTGGAFPLAGFRTMGAHAVATGLGMADSGSGDFQTGDQPTFMAVVEYPGAVLSDPDDAGGGSVANITGTVHTVGSDNVGILVTAAALPPGADAIRFYIGSTIGGTHQWSHYIRTTDPVTGVLFTHCSGLGTHVPGTAPVKTAIGVWGTSNSAELAVLAVMADGRTRISTAIAFAGISGYDRNRSVAWDPVSGALHYEVYLRGIGTTAFSWRVIVPTTQVNSASKPYVLWDWDYSTTQQVSDVPTPLGVLEPIYIGTFTDLVAGNSWGGFLISGRPCEEIENCYLGGTIVASAEYGVNIAAPGHTGYSTLFNTDPWYLSASGLMCAVVFLKGTLLDQALGLNGQTQVRFGVNAKGADPNGDHSGTFTDNLIDVFGSYLDNGPLRDGSNLLTSAPLVTVPPTFSDGSDRRNLTSWARAHLDGSQVITAGMAGGLWITGDETHADVISQFLMSIAGPAAVLTLQKEGPVRIDITNPYGTPSATIVDGREVERGSFSFSDDVEGYATRVGYAFAPIYDSSGSRTLTEAGEEADPLAESASGNDESVLDSAPLELPGRRSAGAALQIALAALRDSAYLPRTGGLTSGMHWVHLNGGQIVDATVEEGTGAAGWANRKLQIRGISVGIGQTRARLTVRDLRVPVGALSGFQVGYFMGNQPLGGSRHDTCVTDPDLSVAAPINRQIATINWNEIDPTTHEVVFDVEVRTSAGTITPNLYLSSEDQGDTPVPTITTPSAHSTDTMTRQQHVVTHQGSGQIEVHMLPVLAGGASVLTARMLGRLRIRRIGTP